MSPLSADFGKSDKKSPSLGIGYYFLGLASLIPFLGVLPGLASVVLGVVKIERKGGWILLALGLLGLCLTAGLTAVYYEPLSQNFFPDRVAGSNNPAGSSDKLVWLQPAEGLRLSQQTQKPILYDFTAEWCYFCKIEKAKLFDNPQDAARIAQGFVPVVVMDRRREEGRNPNDINDLQTRYQIRGFPTLVIQYPGKSDFKQMVGFQGEEQALAFLTQTNP